MVMSDFAAWNYKAIRSTNVVSRVQIGQERAQIKRGQAKLGNAEIKGPRISLGLTKDEDHFLHSSFLPTKIKASRATIAVHTPLLVVTTKTRKIIFLVLTDAISLHLIWLRIAYIPGMQSPLFPSQ
jgi:hypothetical protein